MEELGQPLHHETCNNESADLLLEKWGCWWGLNAQKSKPVQKG